MKLNKKYTHSLLLIKTTIKNITFSHTSFEMSRKRKCGHFGYSTAVYVTNIFYNFKYIEIHIPLTLNNFLAQWLWGEH